MVGLTDTKSTTVSVPNDAVTRAARLQPRTFPDLQAEVNYLGCRNYPGDITVVFGKRSAGRSDLSL